MVKLHLWRKIITSLNQLEQDWSNLTIDGRMLKSLKKQVFISL